MMAVDLHTCEDDSSLPFHLFNHSNNPPQYHTSPLPHFNEAHRKKKRDKDEEEALVADQMATLQHKYKIDFSNIPSQNLESVLSRITQEKIMALKKKLAVHGEKNQNFQKKDNRGSGDTYTGFSDGRRIGEQRPPHRLETQAFSTGSSSSSYSRGTTTSIGTGVFLPRATTTADPLDSSSRRSSGKGCPPTVLIPARVVQALQLHFDQIAATSGPKPSPAFPPLHDVLVLSNRDGMYSLQKRQSKKKPSHSHIQQNDMNLPPEWTY